MTIDTLVEDLAVAKNNIFNLETNTAGITRNFYCPINYPEQQITSFSDIVYFGGDVVTNGTIKHTIFSGNPDYTLENYPISLLRTT